jgi:hypothetical protein
MCQSLLNYCCEVDMNFNHLIPKSELMRSCDGNKHGFYPTGRIESMIGEVVAVGFRCKTCSGFATAFLRKDEYEIHRSLIDKYVESGS